MVSVFFKISRKLNLYTSLLRGFIYFGKKNINIYNNVQVSYPETILTKGNLVLKPYCRLQSGRSQSIVLGRGVTICSFSTIEAAGGNIVIGDNVTVGEYSTFQGQGDIEIGDNVLLASHVHCISNSHTYSDISKPIKNQQNSISKIKIHENAWIGINVVIQAGVTIGKNSVIGSSSIVRSDIPDYCVAVGNPAKVIKRFDFQLNTWVKC